MYPEHFCVPKTMVASVSAQTPVLTDFLKNVFSDVTRKQKRRLPLTSIVSSKLVLGGTAVLSDFRKTPQQKP